MEKQSKVTETRKRFMMFLVTIFTALSLIVAMPSIASAAISCSKVVGMWLPGGPGHSSRVWAGNWDCNGDRGLCVDFHLVAPNSSGTSTITKVPGVTAKKSKAIFWISQTYGQGTNAGVVASAAWATWKLKGGKSFNTYSAYAAKQDIANAMRNRADNMIRQAYEAISPKVSVTLKPVEVGKTSRGVVSVTGTTGKGLKGVKLNLVVNAKGKLDKRAGTTNKAGRLFFNLTKTDVGRVRVVAKATVPNVNKAVLTQPSAGRQRVITAKYTIVKRASTGYDKRAGAASINDVCDTNCDGVAPTTFQSCNAKGASTIKYIFTNQNGNQVTTLVVKGGTCNKKTVKVKDGTQISQAYCYTNANNVCLTDKVKVGKTYEIVCPPWVDVSGSFDCPCEGGMKYKIDLTAPGGVRYYNAIVTVDGNVIGGVQKLGKNGTASVSNVTVNSGQTLKVTYTAYRNSDYTVKMRTGTPMNITNNG